MVYHLRGRWKEVEEIERRELMSLSMESRLKKMNSIFGLAIGLGYHLIQDDSEFEVFNRWTILREQYEYSRVS